jgi:hypothetical protein
MASNNNIDEFDFSNSPGFRGGPSMEAEEIYSNIF